jgi:thiol-disulfide isomerase/thioredoxin
MKVKFMYLVGIIVALLVLLRVIHASTEGFTGSAATSTGGDSFTLYYAEWCPHCKSVKPAFAEWAKNGFVSVGGKNVAVSMVEPEKQPEKAKGKSIKGYPTFILETADGQVFDYEGERTPAGYQKFLEEKFKA